MLKEIEKVKQLEGEPRRRWFASTSLDLFLWYDDKGNIVQFQICYDKGPEEKALTWNHEKGLMHHQVDDGENRSFRMKGTPIMVNTSDFDSGEIITKFEQLAGNIEYSIVSFILSQLGQE
ncbi:MAG: hypothetical protein GKR93_05265 [Gammaproteobacteria bacterium]|nr:hypothetical protein [Gammaproteobacteria bacterium]